MMKIKKADINDLEVLTDLFVQYRMFYGKEADASASKDFLRQRIRNTESEIYIVWEEDEAAGFVQLYPLFSSTRLSRFWLLNDLFVQPDHRGKGFSIALIERAKQLCRDTAACGMYLETEKSNDIGNNLYPKTGFEIMNEVNFYNWDVE